MIETTLTRLESILERNYELKKGPFHIHGTTSTLGLSYFLGNSNSKKINNLPHLVVLPSLSNVNTFQQHLEFIDPNRSVFCLPEFDVNPYSGLYPKPTISAERVQFLHAAHRAKPGEIYVTTINALSQKSFPFHVLAKHTFMYKAGDDFHDRPAVFLQSLGYSAAPIVEDRGQFAIRGGIIDIFSSAQNRPIRIELFGDQVETLRYFDPSTQRSLDTCDLFFLTPANEILYLESEYENILSRFNSSQLDRAIDKSDQDEIRRALLQKNYFPGIEYLLPLFYAKCESPLEHFSTALNVILVDPIELSKSSDDLSAELKADFKIAQNSHVIFPKIESFYTPAEELIYPDESRLTSISNLQFFDTNQELTVDIEYRTHQLHEFYNFSHSMISGSPEWIEGLKKKLTAWKDDQYIIYIGCKTQSQMDRLKHLIESLGFSPIIAQRQDACWDTWHIEQARSKKSVHIIPRVISESLRLEEEKIIFLREEDFFGKKEKKTSKSTEDFNKQARRLNFGDLKPGDLVVHVKHGIGIYEGLKIMPIGGIDSEFIQVGYKEKDKLYLPVYRIGQLQKYSGPLTTGSLDKLGGTAWEKTKIKVKNQLKDIAAELLALYAKRSEIHRPAFEFVETDIEMFEKSFPYEETDDQLRAISDILKDLKSDRPMDRLICGDVGFGKTEVAMRAAFFAVLNKKQVAVLAPTTVLAFQHFETFQKRFEGWPVTIRVLNRFVSTADAKKILAEVKLGKVDILIGTHRIFSKDVNFQNLGLLVIDEEQKFGVVHKEKIKRLKVSVDSLTLSATPIPRTLNLSLTGIRDLSLINTAPVDRLPTRTFVCKFNAELIKKAVESEIARGGQIYFIHNRVQTIYGIADEVRQIIPQARIKVAHGQMEEDELEKAMLAFFHHEIDILICTSIVESGMDVSRANTMFIDSAHMFGLSQLYQLRGRVGRSKTRAYCYLMMPKDRKLDKDAQERLKIIQENSALGSGIKIAQYDLELRGSGNILGDDQSGSMNSVGYEVYMDLLNEALANARGEELPDLELDPEINLRIPALIPDSYISDIRIRLGYYKALADITSIQDLESIEEELRDQFGEIPEATINLMGLMLIRRQCKDLGVRDIGSGLKSVSLIFTERTKLKPEKVISLAMRENKKYSVTPDNRLNIRMNSISWGLVHEELNYLLSLI